MSLILASTSPIRRKLLGNAGIAFDALAPEVDEARLKAANGGADPGHLAAVLADAKALSVSQRFPQAHVLGADQVLNIAGKALGKPASPEGAAAQLSALRGRRHHLETALSCARGGAIVWRHLARPALGMRDFSDDFLAFYLSTSGPAALASVGAYQLESLGAQLFDEIDGDYFAILGLPLLPLLSFLRTQGIIPA